MIRTGGVIRGIAVVAVLVTGAALVWATRDRLWPDRAAPPAYSFDAISLEGAAVKGNAAAPVGVIVYSDYQCPSSRRFDVATRPLLEQRYVQTGRLRLAVRHHPLESIHPHALGAAVAATCAGRQAAFWSFHERLFAAERIDDDVISGAASDAGLDLGAFTACQVDSDEIASVREEAATAAAFGVRGTPSLLIGRIQPDGRLAVAAVLKGSQATADVQRVIDQFLDEGRSVGVSAWWAAAMAVVLLGIMAAWRRVQHRADAYAFGGVGNRSSATASRNRLGIGGVD